MLQACDELGNKYAEAHKGRGERENQGNQGEPAS